MGKSRFFALEFFIFLIMGIITLLEIFYFKEFQNIFTYLKTGIAWFIGLSFGFVFSEFSRSITRKFKIGMIEKRKEYFLVFLLNMILSFAIIAAVRALAITFFNSFFIYFHVLFLQWIIVLYVTFKIKNNYDFSPKYVLVNEIIILLYVSAIMLFVA